MAASAVGTPSHMTPNTYISPVGRRALGGGSNKKSPRVFLSPLALNDDRAEKSERQMSKMLELQQHQLVSPVSGMADRRRSLPLGGLSNAQLTEHYTDCIKLSAENRISAKNAFGLHLIDYMSELFKKKDVTDFQMASSTLDASAKIYAGRVDAIHSEMYKVLSGLGRGAAGPQKTGEGEEDGEEGGEGGGDQDQQAGSVDEPEKKRKRGKKSHTVETNLKNITVNKFDLEFDVDPMFQKTLSAFDDGGTGGLLLNHLRCYDDSCQLVLDCSTVVSTGDAASQLDTSRGSMRDDRTLSTGDVQFLRDACGSGSLDSLSICPAFASFEFMNWNQEEVEVLRSAIDRLGKNEHAFDLDAEPEPIVEAPAMGDDPDVVDDAFGYCAEDDNDDEDGSDSGGLDRRQTAAFSLLGKDALMFENTIQNVKNGELGSLLKVLASEPSDYSYFKTDLLRTWAGPEHWKLQPRAKDAAGDSKAAQKKAKVKQAFVIDFDEELDIDWQLRTTRAATTIAKATLEKNSRLETTLPADLQYEGKQLLQAFNMPAVLIKWQANANAPLIEVEKYNYDNANDKINFCPESQTGPDDDVGARDDDDSCADDDDDYGGTGGRGVDFNLTSGDATMTHSQTSQFDATTLAGDNLLAPPRKIARIEIDYAKVAKRVDVKRLKAVMWDMLTQADPADGLNQSTAGVERRVAAPMRLSALVAALPTHVSPNMLKNLSLPIVFVCLLHLANEKTLKIVDSGDLADLLIGQG